MMGKKKQVVKRKGGGPMKKQVAKGVLRGCGINKAKFVYKTI